MPDVLTPAGIEDLCTWDRILVGPTLCESLAWTCPHCSNTHPLDNDDILSGGPRRRLWMQCPTCDHTAVVRFTGIKQVRLNTEFAGPHVRETAYARGAS